MLVEGPLGPYDAPRHSGDHKETAPERHQKAVNELRRTHRQRERCTARYFAPAHWRATPNQLVQRGTGGDAAECGRYAASESMVRRTENFRCFARDVRAPAESQHFAASLRARVCPPCARLRHGGRVGATGASPPRGATQLAACASAAARLARAGTSRAPPRAPATRRSAAPLRHAAHRADARR